MLGIWLLCFCPPWCRAVGLSFQGWIMMFSCLIPTLSMAALTDFSENAYTATTPDTISAQHFPILGVWRNTDKVLYFLLSSHSRKGNILKNAGRKNIFYSSAMSLGTVRQSFWSKTSAKVGSGGGMHLEMMARWWHSKRTSFDGLYVSIRNIPCSICMWSIRHIHSSHRATPSQNMSAEYLLPNPEGVCDSYIVPINEKNVTVQKLSLFFPFLSNPSNSW